MVFAGAGVSRPRPSDLPRFEELADRIGSHTGVMREPGDSGQEPPDRYLGRLAGQGVKVHQTAAQILVGSHTVPHDLHRLLLQIFPSAQDVRLVTTNFDTHFSTAATAAFKSPVEKFFAPALPLGDDFNGLVYLHGCAGKDPARCVLTDADFGRAYLTEAWASRFLRAMFSKYTVLFVGYSHKDTVMNYLARGLPPVEDKRRFVFTAEASLSKWEFLRIHPVVYRLVEDENPHRALTDSVGRWVADLRSGLLDRAQRIRAIAELQPPLEGEDADFIRRALEQVDTARVFFKHAKHPGWIDWLEKEGLIAAVFDPCAKVGDYERHLASWLTERFVTDHAHHLWAAIQRNGGHVHPHLCWCLRRRLCLRNADDPAGDVFSRWVVVLLTQPHEVLGPDDWALLLRDCRFPTEKEASLLLFERVTRPQVCLKESWPFLHEDKEDSPKVDFELNLLEDRQPWVAEAWEKLFMPNLPAYAAMLEPIVTCNLTIGHSLRSGETEVGRDYDPYHIHRQSIAPHEQDRHPTMLDVLVDAARDILQYLLSDRPRDASGLIAKWFETDVPLLRRLAVYGYAQRADLSADAKLKWLVENGLLYRFKTDVFWFLQQCFPQASEPARSEFLSAAMQGPTGGLSKRLTERTRAYETFNLMVWLQRLAPDCPQVQESLKGLTELHPDFAPREHPEVNLWSSEFEFIKPTEGFDVDAIVAGPPGEWLDSLLAVRPSSPFEKSRSDYCVAASAAVAKSPEWGLEWVRTLLSRGLSDADLWKCLCQGWRNANPSPDQWRQILTFALEVQAPPAFFEAFVDVLEHGARRQEHAIPADLMSLAQQVADRVWHSVLKDSPVESPTSRNWLDIAINRPGGRLAEFWLHRLSTARKQAGDSWRGIPAEMAQSLRAIIRGTSGAAAYGRVILASQLHYFFSLDAQFAQTELLSCLDWQADLLRAEQCWHGFLYWGRWLPGFTEALLVQFNETVGRASELDDRSREALIRHIAGVALFRTEDPLADEWITTIVQKLEDADLERLARVIDHFLDETEAETAENIWDRWLRRYWDLRLLGTPKPLAGIEAATMACWALSVGSKFPEAVGLMTRMENALCFKHIDVFHRIHEKGLASRHPTATAEFTLVYLRSGLEHFHADKDVASVWQDLRHGGVAKEKLGQIREAMFRLGHDPGEP